MQSFQFVEQNTKTKYRKSDRPRVVMREKSAVFFYPQNQKRKSITTTKPKTLDQLCAEKRTS